MPRKSSLPIEKSSLEAISIISPVSGKVNRLDLGPYTAIDLQDIEF
jgi:hypothetical protein